MDDFRIFRLFGRFRFIRKRRGCGFGLAVVSLRGRPAYHEKWHQAEQGHSFAGREKIDFREVLI